MAQGTLALKQANPEPSVQNIQTQSYWGGVWRKLYRDKITLFALCLLIFMISISVGAVWIGEHVLGFNPTKTSLRERVDPPTWAVDAWPQFQDFTRTCQSETGCNWAQSGEILRSVGTGLRTCVAAGLGGCHWMGTDQAGRDVLTRGIYGGRISLRIGIFVAAVSLTLGVFMGLISGYYAATWIDDLINAIIMLLGSIPELFLLIILARIFQPGPEGLALLIGIFGWTGLSRLVRGQIFSVREREYILASRAIGSSSWRIMLQHILPNVSSIIIVSGIFTMAGAIITEAGLSFLGVGIGPPLASWGNMMQGSLGNFTDAPWLVITPGLFIFLTTLSIYLLGDGLRDALDPMLRTK